MEAKKWSDMTPEQQAQDAHNAMERANDGRIPDGFEPAPAPEPRRALDYALGRAREGKSTVILHPKGAIFFGPNRKTRRANAAKARRK